MFCKCMINLIKSTPVQTLGILKKHFWVHGKLKLKLPREHSNTRGQNGGRCGQNCSISQLCSELLSSIAAMVE